MKDDNSVYYVGTSRYCFRPDEVAKVIGIVTYHVKKEGLHLHLETEPRICIAVQYIDGLVDHIPLMDLQNYGILLQADKVETKYLRRT